MGKISVWSAVREQGEISRAIVKKPRLTEATREKSFERSKVLLQLLRKGNMGPIVFCHHKSFVTNRMVNRRNHHFWILLIFLITPRTEALPSHQKNSRGS